MKKALHAAIAAMTLVEVMVYAGMGGVISLVSYSALRSSAILAAKNTNINRSHDDLRGSYDRLARHCLAGGSVPTLIDTNGAAVTSTYTTAAGNQATGPAAGFSFDRNIGGPYILAPSTGSSPDAAANPATAAGTIPSTATSWGFWASSDNLSTAPRPVAGEILVIPTATGSVRVVVSSAAQTATATGRRMFTVNFTAAIGRTISWAAQQPQSAKLVKREAFLVTNSELRYYPAFSPLPTLSDPANFKLMTDQLSTVSGEQTPFSVETVNGDRILTSTLRVRERRDANWIQNDQQNNYNTYFQLHVNLPSRLRPAVTN